MVLVRLGHGCMVCTLRFVLGLVLRVGVGDGGIGEGCGNCLDHCCRTWFGHFDHHFDHFDRDFENFDHLDQNEFRHETLVL